MKQACRIICVIMSIFALVLLSSCNSETSLDSTTSEIKENDIAQSSEATNERGKKFLDEFSNDYPNYEVLDYVVGNNENYPILLAAIAENKEDASSSTLFIVDENGVGQVVLASDTFATYRKEDGISLYENVIFVSMDLKNTDQIYEIHDFEISVTQMDNQGLTDIVYSSNQVIRLN